MKIKLFILIGVFTCGAFPERLLSTSFLENESDLQVHQPLTVGPFIEDVWRNILGFRYPTTDIRCFPVNKTDMIFIEKVSQQNTERMGIHFQWDTNFSPVMPHFYNHYWHTLFKSFYNIFLLRPFSRKLQKKTLEEIYTEYVFQCDFPPALDYYLVSLNLLINHPETEWSPVIKEGTDFSVVNYLLHLQFFFTSSLKSPNRELSSDELELFKSLYDLPVLCYILSLINPEINRAKYKNLLDEMGDPRYNWVEVADTEEHSKKIHIYEDVIRYCCGREEYKPLSKACCSKIRPELASSS